VSRGRKKPKWILEIAQERMDILFNLAKEEFHKDSSRSNRYVELAQNISKKYNTKIPLKWRRSFCKKCHSFLQYGENSTVRLKNSEVQIKCHECSNIMKIPYIKEKKLRRRQKIDTYTIKKGVNE